MDENKKKHFNVKLVNQNKDLSQAGMKYSAWEWN